MEWSKNTMSKAELEKKQREFAEEAILMAKKAGYSSAPPVFIPEEKEIPDMPQEIITEPQEALEELQEAAEEMVQEAAENEAEEMQTDFFIEEPAPEEEEAAPVEEISYGVFGVDELTRAIENGEVSGEGLKQAAEMLKEMTEKTEMMKRLLKEQEQTPESGEEIGLNSYIDRHNNNCRGCGYGKRNAP